jgi:hypothetical protein
LRRKRAQAFELDGDTASIIVANPEPRLASGRSPDPKFGGNALQRRGDHGVLSLAHSFPQYATRRYAPLPACLTILPQCSYSVRLLDDGGRRWLLGAQSLRAHAERHDIERYMEHLKGVWSAAVRQTVG